MGKACCSSKTSTAVEEDDRRNRAAVAGKVTTREKANAKEKPEKEAKA